MVWILKLTERRKLVEHQYSSCFLIMDAGPQESYPSVIKPSLSLSSINKKAFPLKWLLINYFVTSKRKVTSIEYYNINNFQCSAKTLSMQRKKFMIHYLKL